MIPDNEADRHSAWKLLLVRHAVVYAAVNGLLAVLEWALAVNCWSFWLLYGWGLALVVHFFYVKSVTVDDRWVDERTEDLHTRSYDFNHIDDIRERIERDDFSVRPGDRRK